ncbi:MAG TPA: GNAT family N-acetyltransferase [Fontimonas sp.]
MQVRDFQSADTAACLEVFRSNVPKFFLHSEYSGFQSFLGNLPGPYLVIVDGTSRIVACGGLALSQQSRTADLCWGMVLQSEHRRGIGDLLLGERIKRASMLAEIDSIRLDTSQHTVGFYERQGFAVVSTEPDGYGPGLDRCEMKLTMVHGNASPGARP